MISDQDIQRAVETSEHFKPAILSAKYYRDSDRVEFPTPWCIIIVDRSRIEEFRGVLPNVRCTISFLSAGTQYCTGMLRHLSCTTSNWSSEKFASSEPLVLSFGKSLLRNAGTCWREIEPLAVQNNEDASDDGKNCQDRTSALKCQGWDQHQSTGCNQPYAEKQHAPFVSP